MIRIAPMKILSVLAIGLISIQLTAQANHLSTRVSLAYTNAPLQTVFEEIELQGNLNISYNAQLINGDSLVSVKVKEEKVKKVLNRLLPGERYAYKSIGQHLVIYSSAPAKLTKIRISGYVLDARSGGKIANATVYEPNKSITASSNPSGFYEISVDGYDRSIGLNFSKKGYRDSVVYIQKDGAEQANIYLVPIPSSPTVLNPKGLKEIPDVHEQRLVKWVVPEQQINSSKNLQLIESRPAQVSFLPMIGTNGPLSGNYENNLSLNIIAGYSRAVKGVEIGGFLNIARETVWGTQIAGFGNVTGKTTDGAQISGFFNYNGSNFHGVQATGFSNLIVGDINGIQAAGFLNTLKGKMNGVQVAGFANVTTESVDGVQVSGFGNVTLMDVELAQVSGFGNYGRDVGGFQVSGFGNYGRNVGGFQAAGFANVAEGDVSSGQLSGFMNAAKGSSNIQVSGFTNAVGGNNEFQISGFANFTLNKNSGVQLSAFLNYARVLEGYQLGLFNISDSVVSGVPVGLLSFVRSGVHQLEFSSDELFTYNIAFKTGVPAFYNIIKVGRSSELFHFTYGLGTRVFHLNRFNINLEGSLSSIFGSGSERRFYEGNLIRLQPIASIDIWKSFGLSFGPTLNMGIVPNIDLSETGTSGIYANPLFESNYTFGSIQWWAGASLAIHFF